MNTANLPDEEAEANLFAIELLMPRDLMIVELQKLKPMDISDDRGFDERINKLARKFRVPKAMMTQRYFEIRELMKRL